MQVSAAFGRLCVETKVAVIVGRMDSGQPPSGGCVLKRFRGFVPMQMIRSAAFGRLCVETLLIKVIKYALIFQPPSGGCVLKLWLCVTRQHAICLQPPSGGCVLKHLSAHHVARALSSAAFGRLCVETVLILRLALMVLVSRLRAAVC